MVDEFKTLSPHEQAHVERVTKENMRREVLKHGRALTPFEVKVCFASALMENRIVNGRGSDRHATPARGITSWHPES